MKEAEKEAEKIIEMFGSKAILHVEGVIEALEGNQWQNIAIIKHYQQVKQAIENK